MAVTQDHIHSGTPMGANPAGGGATFRVWAPEADEVYVVIGDPPGSRNAGWAPPPGDALLKHPNGHWTGFVTPVTDGTLYRYFVVGKGDSGFKRDPFARELSAEPPFPESNCIVRARDSYPWHDAVSDSPRFHELVIYQLHIGTYFAKDADGKDKRAKVAKFLDVLTHLQHLRKLGINAVQFLPVQEFPHDTSMGYNNLDFFSPEMAYQIEDPLEIARYTQIVNDALAERGQTPVSEADLRSGPNQLKAVIDVLHLNGIAVIFDLVYNHAGGGFDFTRGFDELGIYFFDRRVHVSNQDSQYFTNSGWAGGLVFDYGSAGVRQFLIDNARFFLEDFRIDGIRYDEVSVMDEHGGWFFCQDLTSTCRFIKPEAIQIAEYWKDKRELAVIPPQAGMGFDAALSDRLRDALREQVLPQAAAGANAFVNLDPLRDALFAPPGFPGHWRAVHCLENHDIVYERSDPKEWKPRLAKRCDWNDPRSWHGRSRARFANMMLLTAPGIPMLFMGQEILEYRNWSDNPTHFANTLIAWDEVASNKAVRDFLEFMRAAVRLRRDHPALRGERINVFHVNNGSRVIGFHRWLDEGADTVVIGTLAEGNIYNYDIGFPQPGRWREVFNADYFDNLPNPATAGNGGEIFADGPPMHGLPASARITIPANGVIVFAR